MHRESNPQARSITALILLTLAGCGGSDKDLAQVTGTILLDGEPLADAFVVFAPTSGGTTSYGKTDENGRYEMMFSDDELGAWIGENLVRIRTGDVGAPIDGGKPERVPVVYNTASTLTRDVQPGENTFDFELQSDAGRIVQPMRE